MALLTSREEPGATVDRATLSCPCGTNSGGNGVKTGKRSLSD